MLTAFNSLSKYFNYSSEIVNVPEGSSKSNQESKLIEIDSEEQMQIEKRVNDFYQYLHNESGKTYYTIKRIAHKIGSSPLLDRINCFDENKYNGDLSLFSTYDFIEDLKQILINEKNSLTKEEKEEINSLINTLKFTQDIAIQHFVSLFEKNVKGADKSLKNLLADKVKNTNIGNYFILNVTIVRHAIKLKVIRTEKGYLLKIYNSGNGLIENHKKSFEKSSHYYPNVFEELSEDEVISFLNSIYFPDAIHLEPNNMYLTTAKFYEIAFKILGKSLDEKRMKELNIESRREQGDMGNCAYKSLMASTKDSVSRSTYHLIKDKALNNRINEIENLGEIDEKELSDSFQQSSVITFNSDYYFLVHFIMTLDQLLPKTVSEKINKYLEKGNQNSNTLSKEDVIKMLKWAKIVNLLRIYKHNKNKLSNEEFKKIQEKLRIELANLPEKEVIKFVGNNPKYPFLFGLVPTSIQKELLLNFPVQNPQDYVSKEIAEDEKFMRELMLKNPSCVMSIANEKMKNEFSNDVDLMYALGHRCLDYLEYASDSLRENPCFMLLFYMKDYRATKYFGPKLNQNETFKKGMAYFDKLYSDYEKWLDTEKEIEKPKGDLTNREYFLKLVKCDGRYLSFDKTSFTEDKEIVLEAIKNNPFCFKYTSLKEDEEVVRYAAEKNIVCLFQGYHKFKENYAFMSSVVRSWKIKQ